MNEENRKKVNVDAQYGAARKKKLELIASVLGEVIAAHDELVDEVGYSPLDRRRLDEAALAVVELHATEVRS